MSTGHADIASHGFGGQDDSPSIGDAGIRPRHSNTKSHAWSATAESADVAESHSGRMADVIGGRMTHDDDDVVIMGDNESSPGGRAEAESSPSVDRGRSMSPMQVQVTL